MKKKLFLSSFSFLFLCGFAYAQSPLPVGKTQLNAGIGLANQSLPVYIGLDYSVHKDITVGGELSYRSYRENYNNNKYNHSILGVSANGNYHFNTVLNIPQTWDLYAGLNLGFYSWNSPNNYNGNSNSGIGLGAQVGGRYYLSDKVGLNLELGGGNAFSGGKLGVSIKL